MKTASFVLFFLIVVFSCNSIKVTSIQKKSSVSIIAKWKLIELNAKKIDKETYYVQFRSDQNYSAYAGCNNLGGDFKLNGNQIIFGIGISTEMYCTNENSDRELAGVLSGEKTYEINKFDLLIKNYENIVIAKFVLTK